MNEWWIAFTSAVAAGLLLGYVSQRHNTGPTIGDKSVHIDNSRSLDMSTHIENITISRGRTVYNTTNYERRVDKPDEEDDASQTVAYLFGAFAATVAIAAFYLRYQDTILGVLATFAGFTLTFVAASVGYSLSRKVKLKGTIAANSLLSLISGIVVLIDLYLLQHPTHIGSEYADILNRGRDLGVSQLLDEFGVEGIFFVAYQVLGLITAFLLLALLLWSQLGLLARINVALSQASRSRSSFWDRVADRASAGGPGFLVAMLVFVPLSLGLCSGEVYGLVEEAEFSIPTVPSPSPSAPVVSLAPTID